jgi:hypothetical protein
MPRTVIELSEQADRIVNVVKARDGLKGKSEATESIVSAYEEMILDASLRPDLVEELQGARRGKFRSVESLDELRNGRS